MQPRKISKYPQPPPSLVIKPSAHNSPSRIHTAANRLTSSTSTPERMKVGHALANHIYLGSLPNGAHMRNNDGQDDLLTISIQQSDSPEHKIKGRSQSMSLYTQTTDSSKWSISKAAFGDMSNGQYTVESYRDDRKKALDREFKHVDDNYVTSRANGHLPNESNVQHTRAPNNTVLKSDTLDFTADTRPKTTNSHAQCNGLSTNRKEYIREKKSTLRQNFFDNYSNVLAKAYKAKKKVSFALPSIERDISDVSISSHLSAVSDCLVLDDDEE